MTLRIPTPTSRVTPPPITTPNDLDRSLLDSSLPEGTELREATSLVNSIVRCHCDVDGTEDKLSLKRVFDTSLLEKSRTVVHEVVDYLSALQHR